MDFSDAADNNATVMMEVVEAVTLLTGANTTYIKPIHNGAEIEYAMFASDGTPLAKFPSYNAAFYTARQYDLDPLSIH